MYQITQSDLDYAYGIARNMLKWVDDTHPLWDECMSSVHLSLTSAAKKYDSDYDIPFRAYMAIMVKWGVAEEIRDYKRQTSIGFAGRSRSNRDEIIRYSNIDEDIGSGISHVPSGLLDCVFETYEDELVREYLKPLVTAAINSLQDKRARRFYTLRYLEGLKLKDIAKRYRTSVNTVYLKIRDFKPAVREYLIEHGGFFSPIDKEDEDD